VSVERPPWLFLTLAVCAQPRPIAIMREPSLPDRCSGVTPSSWRVRLLSQAWNEIYGMSVEHRLLHLDIGSPDYLAVPPNQSCSRQASRTRAALTVKSFWTMRSITA
jgi:hypothetical protein